MKEGYASTLDMRKKVSTNESIEKVAFGAIDRQSSCQLSDCEDLNKPQYM